MIPSKYFRRWIIVGPAMLLLLAGCGGDKVPKYRIAGTITSSDGKALNQGSIRFIDNTAGTFEIFNIEGGKFSGTLTQGAKKVVINDLRDPPSGPALIFGEPLKIDYISPKFNRDSKLVFEVAPNDDNVFDVSVVVISDREAERGLPSVPSEVQGGTDDESSQLK